MALRVLNAGPLTTVQDLGRTGFERYGVPQSGAMDWFALCAANRLVGNPAGAAGLEFVLQAPDLQVLDDCLVAAAGRGYSLLVHGRRVGGWRCAIARRGEILHIETQGNTGWGYLAVNGGIDVPLVMGSRSTYLRGGFGGLKGRTLQYGDHLPVGGLLPVNWQRRAGLGIPPDYRPAYADQVNVPVVLGPQADHFTEEGLRVFLGEEFRVLHTSDRMGYRLAGPPIARRVNSELLSEGIAPGSVQVPPDGQPIVLMSDRPATGGYAKIATLALAGLPLLAQSMPGMGKVRFQVVEVAEAQALYRKLITGIEEGME
jgi:antagonist of KipI